MQLTRFTDFGLRVLMYLSGLQPGDTSTIAEIAGRFEVPHSHLGKIVQFMGQQGWLVNVRGKGGGIRLAEPPDRYRLGMLVRTLERSGQLVDCNKPACVLRGKCTLPGLLAQAEERFYEELDQHTLADAAGGPAGRVLMRLHRQSTPTSIL